MGELVALTQIEWPDGAGGQLRLAPGEDASELSGEDAAELRKYGSLGTLKEYEAAQAAAEEEARLDSLRAQAAAEGYRLVKASDGGSGSDKKA